MAQAPMEYTAQNLEYAVSVFYNGEQSERAQAHSWLTSAQRVPNAWQFVWELLQPNKGTEIQFYAATTLHTKVLRCWHELPAESYEELKQKLLEVILTYAHGPKIVTNRLCISLAAFILQQGATDLVSTLAPLSSAENLSLLLEVLTVIPEEFTSMTMGTSLRTKNRTALCQACPRVLEDMMNHLKSAFDDYTTEGPSESTMKSWLRAVVCCGSWLSLGDAGDLTGSNLPNRLPLVRALLHIVRLLVQHNDCVSGTALDCCEACLAAVRTAATSGDAAKHPNAASELMAELVDLSTPIMARDNVPNSINEELVSALITCLVCFTECHCALVVAGAVAEPPTPARELVGLLLAAQEAPGHYPLHETRSNLVFGVWYTLEDELVQGIENMPPPPPLWHDVFTQLLRILIVKSEAHDEDDLTRDDQEMLRCYRQDIADTAMYCFFMMGDACWSTVEAAFESAATDARREAALHCLLAVSDAAPSNRAPPALLSMLHRAVCACATQTDVRMLTTALDAVGSYSPWLSCEAVASTERGAALAREAMLAVGAALPHAPRPAALALRRLCADCYVPAAELVHDIVRAAQSPACQSDSWVRRQLLSACGAALLGAAPDVAAPLLLELCQSLHLDLQRQIAEPVRSTGVAECATALLAALGSSPELVVVVLRVVMHAMPHFAEHAQLVEPMFTVINQIICTLDLRAHGLMADLIRLVLAGLQRMPTAAGFEVVKLLLVLSDSGWEEGGPLLRGAVTAAGPVVGRGLGKSVDVTEGLFKLLHAVTRKRPGCLEAIHDLLPQLVELACECVRMWEAGVARAASCWLSVLCEAHSQWLRPHAPQLTAAVASCIGGGSPRNQLEPLSDLLLAMNKAPWRDGSGALAAWLRQALAVTGFPTPHATDQHKHKFIAAIIKEKSNKRRIMESVQEFSLACRGLMGTEYARQTIASKQLVA